MCRNDIYPILGYFSAKCQHFRLTNAVTLQQCNLGPPTNHREKKITLSFKRLHKCRFHILSGSNFYQWIFLNINFRSAMHELLTEPHLGFRESKTENFYSTFGC